MNNINAFLAVLEAGNSKFKISADSICGKVPNSLLTGWYLLLYPHLVEGSRTRGNGQGELHIKAFN